MSLVKTDDFTEVPGLDGVDRAYGPGVHHSVIKNDTARVNAIFNDRKENGANALADLQPVGILIGLIASIPIARELANRILQLVQ